MSGPTFRPVQMPLLEDELDRCDPLTANLPQRRRAAPIPEWKRAQLERDRALRQEVERLTGKPSTRLGFALAAMAEYDARKAAQPRTPIEEVPF